MADGRHNLMTRLRAGEPAAQREFWEIYWKRMNAICLSILGDESEAADVAAGLLVDFMERAVHRMDGDAIGIATRYLKVAAARRAIRRAEQRRRHEEADFDQLAEDGRMQSACAPEMAVLLPSLDECLDRLKPKAREVIRMKYGEDFANQKIGDLLGGSKQYIGKLLRQSLSGLRDCLAGKRRRARLRAVTASE